MTKAVRIGWLPLAVIAAALIALGGWLAIAPGTQAQGATVDTAVSDANVAIGGTGDSTFTVTPPSGTTVGAIDATVTYDSTLASATCIANFGGVCNAGTPGTVTFSIANTSGISGTAGTITFTGVAAGSSAIDLTLVTCADDQGADLTCTAADGTLTVSVATATPTASPTGGATETPTPTPSGGASGSVTPTLAAGSVTPSPSGSAAAGTPTRTPAGLPTTGGSDSGTDALPYILGLIGLAVVGAGAWAAVRSRRAAR